MTITAEEFKTQLGEEICRLRKAKKWTQIKLAGKVCIHRNTLARYEAGEDIPVILFLRLCLALGTHGKDVLDRILPDAGDRIAEAHGLTKGQVK